MFSYFQKISFKIWLPFAIGLLIILLIAAWYYPSRQEKLFKENKENQIKELAKTVSLGVELSLKNNDFAGLKKTVDFAAGTADFEFVAIIINDPITNRDSVFISYPSLPAQKILQRDSVSYVYEQYPFSAPDFNGTVMIAASKIKINELVSSLNRPIYILFPFLLSISLIIFFLIARRISQPIVDLTAIANELQKGNYDIALSAKRSNDEIGELNNAFESLKESLKEQREDNRQLTLGLEDQIKVRTADLQQAQIKLIEAQKIASLGSFEFLCAQNQFIFSDGLLQIFGISDQPKWAFSDWLQMVLDSERDDFAYQFHTACKKQIRFYKDFRIIKKDTGQVRWISAVGEMNISSGNETTSLVGTMQDITERKLAEEEIDKLSLVAKYTSNLVVITDKYRKIVWVNDSVLKISGYTAEELIGKTPKIFQFEKTNLQTTAMISEKLNRREAVNAEVLNRGKHGNEYWLELNIVSVVDDKGDLTGYIAVENDISERKEADEKLMQSQQELKKINETLEQKVLENTKRNLDLSKSIIDQEKLVTIGEISAGIAHDLNTPLGAIKVGAENIYTTFDGLMRDIVGRCSEEQRNFTLEYTATHKPEIYVGGLQMIKDRKEMLRVLYDLYGGPFANIDPINEMLVKCRINSEDVDVIRKIVDFKNNLDVLNLIYHIQIIGNLLDTIQTSVEKSAKVVRDIKSFIKTDDALERTNFNLHENIKTVLNIFNYELKRNVQLHFDINKRAYIYGYEIKLFQLWSNLIKNAIDAMEDAEQKILNITSQYADDQLKIIVENSGKPIPVEILDKIFKKFFTTKQQKGGTGLGLSIVKNVADEHGATIHVESDTTTRFAVIFKTPYFQLRQF
jgi:PAS domain S-box-containing protein